MEERRYYSVAGHVFSVTADETVFAQMTNYVPFRLDGAPQSTVFDLMLTNEPLPENRTHVFTDATDAEMPRIEIYRAGTDWLFLVAPTRDSETRMRLFISPDFHDARLQILSDTRFCIDNACMILFACATAPLHTLTMHAAVVVRHDRGFLFLGKSGTGKSTHARMWLQAFDDAWLLNDDNPVLRLLDNGEVRVYGSPWSGKTPCYIPRDVPVGEIIQLAQAPQNNIRTLRLPEAYACMLPSVSGLKIEPAMMDALYDTISRVIQTVPVRHLDCLPDTDAARVCAEAVQAR